LQTLVSLWLVLVKWSAGRQDCLRLRGNVVKFCKMPKKNNIIKLPSHRWFLTYILDSWLENTMWKPAGILPTGIHKQLRLNQNAHHSKIPWLTVDTVLETCYLLSYCRTACLSSDYCSTRTHNYRQQRNVVPEVKTFGWSCCKQRHPSDSLQLVLCDT